MPPRRFGTTLLRDAVVTPRLDLDLDDEIAVLEIQESIATLDGIQAVRLIPGTKRPVDELHVVITPERDPKQTVRDLQSLLIAHHGIDIDRRVISVVQLPSGSGARLRDGIPRVELQSVNIEVRGSDTSVTVEVRHAGTRVLGCVGPLDGVDVVEATADATVDAVSDCLEDHTIRLEGAELATVGTQRVAVVVLAASNRRTRDTLTGSAAVLRHEADAVARAVLDATNRLHRG